MNTPQIPIYTDMTINNNTITMKDLASKIKAFGLEIGFQQVGITNTDLSQYDARFKTWLNLQYHGEMSYMEKHGSKRTHPDQLIPGTLSIISARMDYLPANTNMIKTLMSPKRAYISRYALGRDYHKVMRNRLNQLAQYINSHIKDTAHRVFADSAPVLEKPLAEKAGLGWIGKNTNLINSKAGSWFFLGEIFTSLPLPIDQAQTKSHCGSCQACIDICPTKAIIAPYQLDARRCISYLTIELKGSIPLEFRPLIGNRIYGCDDCQLCCPWNKFSRHSQEDDFKPRHQLADIDLVNIFEWDEAVFLKKTEGSAIQRIGHAAFLRNIAVALGNAPYDERIIHALQARLNYPNTMVQEHIHWALDEHFKKCSR